MELEADDFTVHEYEPVMGGYKAGELICVVAGGPTQLTAIQVLESLSYEIKEVSVAEMDKLMGKVDAEFILVDDSMCPEFIDPDMKERKRRGKRKNPNPYQSTMKRGR